MVYSESGFKSDPTNRIILADATKTQLLFVLWKIICHSIDYWFRCHNKGEPTGSLKVPYVGIQRNRNSNMPHCCSCGCSTSTGTDRISRLFCVCYPLSRPELKQWSSGLLGIDSHSHSADARRSGWIDQTMKTTTNSCQTSPQISDIHYVTKIHLHSSKVENS